MTEHQATIIIMALTAIWMMLGLIAIIITIK